MRIHVEAEYLKGDVNVVFFQYATNFRTAIDLVDPVTGEHMARASVNLREVDHMEDDEVALKGWSENIGIPEALMEAGVVGPPIKTIYLTYVDATIHKILRRE